MSDQTTEQNAPDSLHEIIKKIRGGDVMINDPAEAERVMREAIRVVALPRAIVSLSIRERALIPKPVLKEILNSGERTDLSPEQKIRAWVRDPKNLHAIHSVKEFSEMIGVNGGQMREFMRNYGWIFKKSEGRTYEIRADEKNA
jgi:hypothetical protein